MMMNRKCLLINIRSVLGRCSVKKVFLESLQKFIAKHLCWSSFFKKLQVRPAILFKKKLRHRFFSGNFVKFLRISFLTEHLQWLLLKCEKAVKTVLTYWYYWKKDFSLQGLNIALLTMDLNTEKRLWTICWKEICFQHMWNNRKLSCLKAAI